MERAGRASVGDRELGTVARETSLGQRPSWWLQSTDGHQSQGCPWRGILSLESSFGVDRGQEACKGVAG
jgi:hypothetical protein